VMALAAAGWRHKMPERVVFPAVGLFYLVTVFYDHGLTELDSISIYPYRGLLLYAVIGWTLVSRFARSIRESEELNAELEQRVEAKHAELESNYKAMEQLQRQAAVVEERQRIMSDMHDGIGGQLISTLSLVEHGEASQAEVAAALRECIDDLRLTIDSLEPTENDLLPVLGNLRYRLDGRLKKQGINLDWQVKEVPKLACLTPQNVLHILRILQEAFTNALKHAHASIISVETGTGGGNRVFIRIRDNGNGFQGDHRGHGLASMRRRAEVIGGQLDIQPSPTGTTLSLLLPVS
jgi:signal transduction histidine kinase